MIKGPKLSQIQFPEEKKNEAIAKIIENIHLIHVNSTVNENRSSVNRILQKGSLHGFPFRGHNAKGKSFACLFWKTLYPFYWNNYKDLKKITLTTLS